MPVFSFACEDLYISNKTGHYGYPLVFGGLGLLFYILQYQISNLILKMRKHSAQVSHYANHVSMCMSHRQGTALRMLVVQHLRSLLVLCHLIHQQHSTQNKYLKFVSHLLEMVVIL